MTFAEYQNLIRQIMNDDMTVYQNQYDIFQLLLDMQETVGFGDRTVQDYAMKISKYTHEMASYQAYATGSGEFDDLYWLMLRMEAPFLFESYLYYMEKNRADSRKFYKPREKTLHVLAEELQNLEDGKYKFLGISLPPRVGKLLADDTPVLTSNGWKNHGDLVVGDYVYDNRGHSVMVTRVFPKNFADKRVHFSDGSFIDCHRNHEWIVFDRHKQRERIAETWELIDGLENNETGRGHRYFYLIPHHEALSGKEQNLPVAPYTLGAWLGDGRNNHPDICGSESDYAIVESIVRDGYEISWHTTHKQTGVEYYGFKGLRKDLQQLGMCHSGRRVEKHIPDIYLCASVSQRLELLAGLLDTDGTLTKKEHRYSFSTTSEPLKEDFISLVSTFGWRCTVTVNEPHTSSFGIVGKKKVWRIAFNPSFEIPCRLERKHLTEFSQSKRVAITAIEDIKPKSGNCISVDGGVYCVGRRCVPTHNSTVCLFFLSWIMGKRPWSHNAMSGHSGILADGFYGEVLNLIATPEYTFGEIFPGVTLQKKSADKKEINLGKPDRFPTLTCRGIDGTWTGAVDISADGYLYVDDLVRDRMESLSPTRLENRYQDYLNVLVDRKNDGSRELMVGTRWNVLDPLGRVEADKKNDPLYRFVKIPALDRNGESNFDYEYGVGFSTEYFVDVRSRLDSNEWEAKYQQKPFIREGLLFPEDELQFYNGVLPEGDSRVVAACDVAWGGGDSLSMPIGREYEDGSVYIFAWVFNKGKKEDTLPLVTGQIMNNEIRQIRFEGNTGGDLYAQYVGERLKEHNYKCSCTSKKAPTTMAKMEKIIGYSGDIKRKYRFLDEEHRDAEYQAAMEELCMFVTIGKNEHDDAADGLTQLEMFVEGVGNRKETFIMPSLF